MRCARLPAPVLSGAIAIVMTVLIPLSAARGANRWIEESLSSQLRTLVADPRRDYVYVADNGAHQIIAIDTVREEVADRFPVPGEISDLALSLDGSYLYAATFFNITRVYLPTMQATTFDLPDDYEGGLYSIAAGRNGVLFAVSSGNPGSPWISVIDVPNEKLLHRFTRPPPFDHFLFFPFIRSNSEGDLLWLADAVASPFPIDLFDVGDPLAPHHVRRKDDIAAGFLNQFVPSPHGPERLFVGAGGEGAIVAVDGLTLDTLARLPVSQPHVIAVATSALGSDVFGGDAAIYHPQFLFQFDAQTFEPVAQYPLEVRSFNGQIGDRGLGIERRGAKAFLVHGSDTSEFRVQVVDVITTIAPAIPALARPGALLLLVLLAFVATLMIRRRAS